MIVESDLKRKKKSLKFFYQMAQEALDAEDLEQAIEISAKGLEEAELENQTEWAEKFDALSSQVVSAKESPTLNTSMVREDITVIKGVGVAVAEKLKHGGFHAVKSIADATIPQIILIPGIGQKTAQKIIEGAKIYIGRKRLNDFPEEKNEEKKLSIKSEIIEDPEISEIQKSSTFKAELPWFKDELKINKPEDSQSTRPDYNNEYLLEEVEEVSEMEDISEVDNDLSEDEEEIGTEINHENKFITQGLEGLREPIRRGNLIEKQQYNEPIIQESVNDKPVRNKTTQLNEKLLPSEKKTVIDGVIHTLQGLGFYVTEKILKGSSKKSDLIAMKIIRANEFLDLVLILPIKLNILKGEIKISNKQVKYIPLNEKFNENGSTFRLLLNSTISDLGKAYNMMQDDLVNDGKLLGYLKKYLQVDISIEKSITKKNLFFRAGALQYKILIEPILICNNEVGFLEKIIPFPYLKDLNLHVIKKQKLPSFLTYLEDKYTLLEEHSDHKTSLIVYEKSFNQFLQTGKKVSLPFIGFGFILLMLVLFQSFIVLELVVNIGYALLGVYSTSLAYLYIKFFKTKLEIQTDFSTPFHQKQLSIDDTELILIKNELGPEMMHQFVYECLGKSYNSRFINKLEESRVKERLNERSKSTLIKTEFIFEEPEEKEEFGKKEEVNKVKRGIKPEDDELIHKYSSFLED